MPITKEQAKDAVDRYRALKAETALPSGIRVGYRDYAVEEWDGLDAQAKRRLGETNHLTLVIRVRKGMKAAVAAEVLLHEIMHCCFWLGFIQDEDDEERTVTALANQLTQVWRDNPEFVAFMSRSLTPRREAQDA